MIIDIFKYYAGFPKQDGVTSLFVAGRSENNTYKQLLQALQESATHSRIPEIDHYVFGGSYEAVKTYIDTLSGIYLFVEFGEFSSTRQRGSIHDTFRIAVTIAGKKTTRPTWLNWHCFPIRHSGSYTSSGYSSLQTRQNIPG